MANLNTFINIGGNAINGNTVSVTGNVTGNVIRVASNIVAFPISSPAPSLNGFGSINSVDITATGNITGNNINIAGLITATGNITAGNVRTAGSVSATGNITATGNIAGGNVSTSGNVTGGNVLTSGVVSAAGNISAGNVSVSGMIRQNSTEVVIGASAGAVSHNSLAIAIGGLAGYNTQSTYGIAVGYQAGYFGQGSQGIAIGYQAGQTAQGSNSIAIGRNAGNAGLTGNSIAIGAFAAVASSAGNIIVLNATGSNVNGTTANALYVNPVRNDSVTAIGNVAVYNTTTYEVAYSNTISLASNITGGNLLTSGIISTAGNIAAGNIALTGNLTVNGAPIYGAPSSYAKYTRTTQQTGNLVANTVVVCNVAENTFGSDISVNTSTGQVTLQAGRTYRLRGSIPGWTGTSASVQWCWYNETTPGWLGESGENYPGSSGASYGAAGGSAEAVFTANATTVVSFRLLYAGTLTGLGGNNDFSTTASYPWIDVEVIGGQAPITGFSTTGNVYASNFIGNISIVGNVQGTSSNVTLVAGSYNWTFDNGGNLTLPSSSVINKSSGYVNAGSYITLDNIKATLTSSGNRGLGLATVSGSFTATIGATYSVTTNGTNGSGGALSVTTSVSTSVFGWNFTGNGDVATYIVNDTTNSRTYRIILMIGPAYANNFISIERL